MERIAELLSAQGKDGGWGYTPGASSWTEPTALALLALSAAGGSGGPVERGTGWLRAAQRADGGWAPNAAVKESTWVTSLSVLALARVAGEWDARLGQGAAWLLQRGGRQESRLDSFRAWLFRQPHDAVEPGWPWCPGTASWVIPTAMAILALERVERFEAGLGARRIAEGREFLLARRCAGGGWNHGGTFLRSENARAYPETTGIALMALRGTPRGRLGKSLDAAERMLSAPESSEGASWLRLGLAAHGNRPEAGGIRKRDWTTVDLALEVMAAMPVNPFFAMQV